MSRVRQSVFRARFDGELVVDNFAGGGGPIAEQIVAANAGDAQELAAHG